MLRVRRIDQFGFPILQVSGHLDLMTFGKLMAEIGALLEQKPATLGLDLSGVRHADVAGVSLVATTAECLAGKGGRLRLVDTSPQFEQALQANGTWLRPHSRMEVRHPAA